MLLNAFAAQMRSTENIVHLQLPFTATADQNFEVVLVQVKLASYLDLLFRL